MGFLKTLKRWFNQRDAYDQLTTLNRYSPYSSRERVDGASKAAYSQLKAADELTAEPLEDVEIDSETAGKARWDRLAAIENEKKLRESR